MKARLLVAMLTLNVLSTHEAFSRKWTDSTGRYTVEAELVAVEDGEVRLRKADGQVIIVSIDRLSRADQRYLESAVARPQENGTEPVEKTAPESTVRPPGERTATEQDLDKPVRYEFVDSPLMQSIQDLSSQHDIPWYIDQPGIRDTGLPAAASPITGKEEVGETLGEALDKLLGPRGFAWLIRHDVLFVTTAEQARRFTEPRVYVLHRPVPNLIALAREIRQNVSPESWDSAGGPGSITVGLAGVVVVSQSYPVHRQIQRQYGRLMQPVIGTDTPPAERIASQQGPSKLLRALNETTVCKFFRTPLEDVVTSLSERHQIDIAVDRDALGDAGIDTKVPITADLYGIKLQSALSLMLRAFDMVWTVDQGSLVVTTRHKQETMLVPVTYEIRDLSVVSQGNVDWLIQLITTHVKPASWASVGGPAQISAAAGDGRLQIRQTFHNHRTIQCLLDDLRQAQRR